MRTRREIIEDRNLMLHKADAMSDRVLTTTAGTMSIVGLSLEVLLDIRDLLSRAKEGSPGNPGPGELIFDLGLSEPKEKV